MKQLAREGSVSKWNANEDFNVTKKYLEFPNPYAEGRLREAGKRARYYDPISLLQAHAWPHAQLPLLSYQSAIAWTRGLRVRLYKSLNIKRRD